MRKLLLLAGIISCSTITWCQQVVPCVTDELYVESLKAHPEIKQEEEKSNNEARVYVNLQKSGTIRYIPVVFHIIHKWGLENISQAQLNDAIRVLNEDYRKVTGTAGGASTDPLAVDMEYEFRLAQFDPNGQPCSGVNRIYSTATDNAYDTQKALSYWDSKKYFNIWVVNSIQNSDPNTTILGYAQFPFQINSQGNTDGVMVRADQPGAIEFANLAQSGRTLTHESGHWLGLYHPFQGGCVGGNGLPGCEQQGDQVCDTPPVATSTSGCPSSRNSCTNDVPDLPDQIRNYMDYADGTCMNMFTQGQKTRTLSQTTSYRANTFSAANLSAIGINADGTYKALTASTLKAPYSFGFNVSSLSGTGWNLENYTSPGDSGWAATNNVGYQSSGCMQALNLKNNRLNVRNAFTSPNIDISSMSSPSLRFYVAYAKRLSVSGDKLRVFVSNNYGRTEVMVKEILTADIETGAVSTSAFIPGAGEWRKITIDLSPYKTYTNCRIRFELKSLKGNNIYVDEFYIGESTDIAEILKQKMQFSFYPNPAHQEAKVSINLTDAQNLEMNVLDLNGKVVSHIDNQSFENGQHEITIALNNLSEGIYLLQVKSETGAFVHKFIVN